MREEFRCIDCEHCKEARLGYICEVINSNDNMINGVSLYTSRYCGDGEKKK